MTADGSQKLSTKRPRLIWRLLVGVNLTIASVLGLFMLWDYRVEWRTHLQEKRTALQDEARILLAPIARLREQGQGAVQGFLDEACGAMQESSSPGHHIAVRLGEETLQARVRQRHSPEMLAAMEQAASSPARLAALAEDLLIVGSARRDDQVVYVSEYVSTIRRILRSQVVRRVVSILAVGVTLAVVLNLLLSWLLVRPLPDMIRVVRQLGGGQLGARMQDVNLMELGWLSDEFNRMAGALEKSEMERHLRMNRARRIQQNLLPDLSALPDWRVCSFFQPADEVAGDYYDAVPLPDGTLLLCMADVSGHGIPAALGAAMLKGLLLGAVEKEKAPGKLLHLLNRAFLRVSLPEDFATMIVVRLDRQDGVLTYASAGHEPAYLIPSEGETQLLPSTGPLLGIEAEAHWESLSLQVKTQDRLVLVSDGVVEAVSSDQEPFGRKRLRAALEQSARYPLQRSCELLQERISAFRGSSRQHDDITLLVAQA
jgi:serine phosphatase RsbU (regulator of sigma subunit)